MLRDIFESTVDEQNDMKVVDILDSPRKLLQAAQQKRADVAIVGLEGAEVPHIWRDLLNKCPQMKVLAVAADGSRALLYELRPHKIPIGEASPDQLLDAIRDAVRKPPVRE